MKGKQEKKGLDSWWSYLPLAVMIVIAIGFGLVVFTGEDDYLAGSKRDLRDSDHSGKLLPSARNLSSKSNERLQGGVNHLEGEEEFLDLKTEEALKVYLEEREAEIRSLRFSEEDFEQREARLEELSLLSKEERREKMRQYMRAQREARGTFEASLSDSQKSRRDRLQKIRRLGSMLNLTEAHFNHPDVGESASKQYDFIIQLLEEEPRLNDLSFQTRIRELMGGQREILDAVRGVVRSEAVPDQE